MITLFEELGEPIKEPVIIIGEIYGSMPAGNLGGIVQLLRKSPKLFAKRNRYCDSA